MQGYGSWLLYRASQARFLSTLQTVFAFGNAFDMSNCVASCLFTVFFNISPFLSLMPQIYSHCNIPVVKEAAWSLFVRRSICFACLCPRPARSLLTVQMSAINLVKAVPEKEQERIRSAHTVRYFLLLSRPLLYNSI